MSTAAAPTPSRDVARTGARSVRAPRMFSTELTTPWPARGLGCSVLAHLLFLAVTLIIPWNYWLPSVRLVTMQSQVREQELLLPELQPMTPASKPTPAGGGGKPGSSRGRSSSSGSSSGASKKSAQPAKDSAPAAAAPEPVQGVVHPGPQIIISNPPHPDNSLQTVLQPDLVKPPTLPKPLPVPAMVSVAPSVPQLVAPPPQPEPAPEPAKPVAVLPLSVRKDLPTVEAPKLPVSAAGAQEKQLNTMTSAPLPAALPKLARPQVALADDAATGTHNVLVVNAIPVPGGKPTEIPPGELHGAFTISPSGSYSPAPSPRAGGGTAPVGAPGAGTGTGTATGTGASAGIGTAAGTGTGLGTAGNGAGIGTGAGHGTGAGLAGTGTGSGIGSGTGIGAGTGSGNGSGSGSGVGAGAGSGVGTGGGSSPFAGVTIEGGPAGSGRTTRASISPSPRQQPSYGFTIVGNKASGGAFKDYGIFTERASYTIYVDMNDEGVRASWPLQYALDTTHAPDEPPVPTLGALEPPYAILKGLPLVTPEAAARLISGSRVVVYGVINRLGHLEKLRIMQSAGPQLDRIVLEALAKWKFEPAKMYERPVPVKCLLGVPLSSLPIQTPDSIRQAQTN